VRKNEKKEKRNKTKNCMGNDWKNEAKDERNKNKIKKSR
jgi:hypothetical protein